MTENYDTSWDLIESDKGNLPDDEYAYERKYQEWMERDWIPWLREHLSFPFQVKRMEDEDDAYFTDVAKHKPFRLRSKQYSVSNTGRFQVLFSTFSD